MIRLKGHYQGFKVGVRVADDVLGVLGLDTALGKVARHALKNIALAGQLESQPDVFEVNGVFHAPTHGRQGGLR